MEIRCYDCLFNPSNSYVFCLPFALTDHWIILSPAIEQLQLLIMTLFKDRALKLVRSSPSRTFILFPALMLAWELFLNKGKPHVQLPFLLGILWGYLQYRLSSNYRKNRGRSGPSLREVSQQLLKSGIYASLRNPIYLESKSY